MPTLGPQIVSQSYGNLLKFLPTGEAGVTTLQVQITDGKGKVTPLHLATGSVLVDNEFTASAEVVFSGLTQATQTNIVCIDGSGRLYFQNSSSFQDDDWTVGSLYMTASGQTSVYIPNKLENGNKNSSVGNYSHAEGSHSLSLGQFSHAEGRATTSSGYGSHAEGVETNSPGAAAHAEGKGTIAGVGLGDGDLAHAEGHYTKALSFASHAEGNRTYASASYAHAEGNETSASGQYSHAEGNKTLASGPGAHAEGSGTLASNLASHAEGIWTTASQWGAHAEGRGSIASAAYSHAEGLETLASNLASHAEGKGTIASDGQAHAEGHYTVASGWHSHAEGNKTLASGTGAHSEGTFTTASGNYSHAEGDRTTATGDRSHAEGSQTNAVNDYSHAEGLGNVTYNEGQTVAGKWNEATSVTQGQDDVFAVGVGNAPFQRKTGLQVNEAGSVIMQQQTTVTNAIFPPPLYLPTWPFQTLTTGTKGLYLGRPGSGVSHRISSHKMIDGITGTVINSILSFSGEVINNPGFYIPFAYAEQQGTSIIFNS